jgi:hypothetical protein
LDNNLVERSLKRAVFEPKEFLIPSDSERSPGGRSVHELDLHHRELAANPRAMDAQELREQLQRSDA